MVSAGDFRNGVTLEIDGQVVQILEFQHVKPGKGAAFVRTKLKNVINGGVVERTFRPTEKFPAARIDRVDMQYRMFYQRMNSGGEWYSGRQQTYQNPAGGMGSWCMKLIFINLMCNCCLGGGGLCCPGRYY